MTSRADRALGALVGLALGDALGMPTQLMSRREVVARYGPVLDRLHPGAPDHPIAAGLAAGSTTDDTAQALLLADRLVAGAGRMDQRAWADDLIAWEDRMRAAGSLDLLGPSTRGALDALIGGAPVEQAGRNGTTNGAAMRIAPVGIATPPDPVALVDAVVEASRLTHGTSVALAGAAAVAGAVSAGVHGADLAGALELALACARLARERGRWVAGADLAARIDWAVALTAGLGDAELVDRVATLVGTSLATTESVPAAFAFACARVDDPWLAVRLAASAGGDTDTIAAMTGAVLGSVLGADVFDVALRRQVEQVNGLDLAATAERLLVLRDQASPRPPVARVSGRPGDPGRLVYVGQGVVDLVLRVPHLPEAGGDVLAGPLQAHPGGGVNVMLAAARLGRGVLYAGRHGTGPHGDLVRASLAGAGVELALPADPTTDTGTVLVLVDASGERTFVTSPGAEARLSAADLLGLRPAAADLVVLGGYALAHPANRAAVASWLAQLDASVRVLLDPGPLAVQAPADVLDAVLARADWVSANESEARALTGADDPWQAARRLAGLCRGRAVLRRGPAGCLVVCDGEPVEVPAPAVAVVDLTGAGDAHTAAFADGLLRGLDPVAAASRANAAAALAVTRRGPATGPTTAELEAQRPRS